MKILPDASGMEIRRGLTWLRQSAQDSDDIALFYFSGHGKQDHLLPRDFNGQEGETGILKTEIITTLTKTNGRRLFFIDACQAAGGLFDLDDLVKQARERGNGITVAASSLADEKSAGEPATDSYFTTVLVEGLKGEAAAVGSDEVLTDDLYPYLRREVRKLSRNRQKSDMYIPFGVPSLRLARLKK